MNEKFNNQVVKTTYKNQLLLYMQKLPYLKPVEFEKIKNLDTLIGS
jgi:hypothetical protein